jgi:hypothetical protein
MPVVAISTNRLSVVRTMQPERRRESWLFLVAIPMPRRARAIFRHPIRWPVVKTDPMNRPAAAGALKIHSKVIAIHAIEASPAKCSGRPARNKIFLAVIVKNSRGISFSLAHLRLLDVVGLSVCVSQPDKHDISKEGRKALPAITDGDAAPTITLVTFVFLVEAASHHGSPRTVLRRSLVSHARSVDRRPPRRNAATRSRPADSEIDPLCNLFVSAITPTAPSRTSALTASKRDNRKAA